MGRLESLSTLRRDPRTARDAKGWSVFYQGFGPIAAQMFAPFLPVSTIVCAFDGAEVDEFARSAPPKGLGAKVFTYERAKGVRHASVGLFDDFFLDDRADEIAAAIAAAPGRTAAIPFASSEALERFLFRRAPDALLAQNPVVVRRFFENKLLLAAHAGEIGVPLPRAARIALCGDLAYAPLAAAYPTGFVLQVAFSQHGAGTEFVFSEADFNRVMEALRAGCGEAFGRTQVKITPFLNGPSLNCTGVVLHGAVALSPVDVQIVGDPNFISVRGQYIGSDFSYPVDPNLREEVLRITRKIGEWLGAHGYRGNFGVDLLTTMDPSGKIREVFVSEVNARLVGESQYMADFEAMEDVVPLIWFHLAEFLRWDVAAAEVEAYNRSLHPVRGAALILYTREKGIFRAAGGLRPGVYRIPAAGAGTGGRLERLREGWILSDTRADDEFVVTNGVPWRENGRDLVIGHPRYGDVEIPIAYLLTRESILDPADPRRISAKWVEIARAVERAAGLVPVEPRSLRPVEGD